MNKLLLVGLTLYLSIELLFLYFASPYLTLQNFYTLVNDFVQILIKS